MRDNKSNISYTDNKEFGTVSIIVETEVTKDRFEKRVLGMLKNIIYNTLGTHPRISKTTLKDVYIYTFTGVTFTPMAIILNQQVYGHLKSICCDTCAIEGFEYVWSDKALKKD
jgi:hypothetical protein